MTAIKSRVLASPFFNLRFCRYKQLASIMASPFRVMYLRQPSYSGMLDEPSRLLEHQLGLRPSWSDDDVYLPDLYRAMLLQPQLTGRRPRHQAGAGTGEVSTD